MSIFYSKNIIFFIFIQFDFIFNASIRDDVILKEKPNTLQSSEGNKQIYLVM